MIGHQRMNPRALRLLLAFGLSLVGSMLWYEELSEWLKWFLSQRRFGLLECLLGCFLLLFWWKVSILLHEVGHAVAGKCRGMHFVAIAFGGLQVKKTEGRLVIGKGVLPSGIAGYSFSYSHPDPPSRADYSWYVFGGPLSNLLGCAALLPIWTDHVDVLESPLLGWSLLSFGGISAAFWIAFLKHFALDKSDGTDGHLLRQAWTNDPDWKAVAALHMIGGLLQGTKRPRDLPRGHLEDLETSATPRLRASYHWIRSLIAYDNENPEQALAHASKAVEAQTDEFRGVKAHYAGNLALCLAEARGDLVEARDWLAKYHGPLVEDHRRMTVEASILLAEGEPQAARELLDTAKLAWPQAVFPITEFDIDSHRRLATRCRSLKDRLENSGDSQQRMNRE